MTRKRGARGFTLIELLVVVAIIALLISILLPSLRDAREQAKVAKCLAHYRQLTTSANQYFLDWSDNFPFYVISTSGVMTTNGVCTWSYGGKTTSDYWLFEYSGGLFGSYAKFRPLNEYLMSGKLEDDLWEGGKIIKRVEVPVVQCPGDRMSNQRGFNQPELKESPVSCYDDVGTSFHWNLHAISDLTWNGNTNPWWQGPGNWQERGQGLVKDVLAKYSSSFVMFIEDPMDWALGNPMNKMLTMIGNHGKLNKHCAGFLDGHADYKTMDTRGWCGPGWQVINPEWIKLFGSKQPIYYVGSAVGYPSRTIKNCNPPKP